MKKENLKKAISQLIKSIKQFDEDVKSIKGILETPKTEVPYSENPYNDCDVPYQSLKVKRKERYKLVKDEIDEEEEEYLNMSPNEQAISDLKKENERLGNKVKDEQKAFHSLTEAYYALLRENVELKRKIKETKKQPKINSEKYEESEVKFNQEWTNKMVSKGPHWMNGAEEMAQAVHKWLGEIEMIFDFDGAEIRQTFMKHLKDGHIKPE